MDRRRSQVRTAPALPRKSATFTAATPSPVATKRDKRDTSTTRTPIDPPMKNREVLLDLIDRKKCDALKTEIHKMGGSVVDFIAEDKPPFLIVSDHPAALKLQLLKIQQGTPVDAPLLKKLPMLLKDAVRLRIRVRDYATFLESISRAKLRFKTEKRCFVVPSAPQKPGRSSSDKGASFEAPEEPLVEPFIKIEDLSGNYAPNYKEMSASTGHFNTLHVGKYFGHSLFHQASTDQQERREREIEWEMEDHQSEVCPSPTRANPPAKASKKGGFCEICAKASDNLKQHFATKEHQSAISQPGFYDEVDALLGSYEDHIVIRGMRTLPRNASQQEETRSDDFDGDYEYSEGRYLSRRS